MPTQKPGFTESYFSQIEARLARLETRDLDLKNRRARNASDALLPQDYTTLAQVQSLIPSLDSSVSANPSYSFAYNSATQTVATATTTKLTYDTNVLDSGALHSTSVNPTRFTALEAGLYLILCQIIFPLSALGTLRQLNALVNNSAILPNPLNVRAPSAAVLPTCTILFPYRLNIRDYVEFTVFHDAGINQVLLANDSYAGFWKIA